MNTQTIKIDYNINRMEPVDLISTIHIDDKNTRYLELTLLDHGTLLVLQGCTVKARFVATDKALLSDNVPCTVTADNTILVPIDAAAVQSMACDLRIEVNIVSGTDVLTLPFPLWVRVRGSILDNAPVTPDTEGTVAELLRQAEEELSRVRGFVTNAEAYAILDEAFLGDDSVSPQLLVSAAVDAEHNPDGHLMLYYVDSEEVRHNIFDFTPYLGGTDDYSQLTNKPQINGVTLDGDKSPEDLLLQKKIHFTAPPAFPSEDYQTGDLFYYNKKLYRQMGTGWNNVTGTYVTYNKVGRYIYYGQGNPPTSADSVSVPDYDPGDLHVKRSSSMAANSLGDMYGAEIYLCADVLFNSVSGSPQKMRYTYTWIKLPIGATTLSGYGIADAYTKTQADEIRNTALFTMYDNDLYDAETDTENSNVILFLFGYDNNNSPTCGLDKLTAEDYGKVWHIVLTFTKANLAGSKSVRVQEHKRGAQSAEDWQTYNNVAEGNVIRFDYTMSDSTVSILRLRLKVLSGEQKVHVKISEVRQLDYVLDTKANVAEVNTALAAKANTADVNTALATKADANPLPAYCRTEIERVKTAVAAAANYGDVVFGLFTDLHFGDGTNLTDEVQKWNAIRCMRKIADESLLDFVIQGGDLMTGGNGLPLETYARDTYVLNRSQYEFNGSRAPLYTSKGDHDSNQSDTKISKSDFAKRTAPYMPRAVRSAEYPNNYYFDLPEKKTRIINIDTGTVMAGQSGRGADYTTWTNEQLFNWLLDDVFTNDVKNGWRFIIFSHAPCDYEWQFGMTKQFRATYPNDITNSQNAAKGNMVVLNDLLEAINSGGNFTTEKASKHYELVHDSEGVLQEANETAAALGGDVYTISGITKKEINPNTGQEAIVPFIKTKNFSGWTSKARLILSGHCHCDRLNNSTLIPDGNGNYLRGNTSYAIAYTASAAKAGFKSAQIPANSGKTYYNYCFGNNASDEHPGESVTNAAWSHIQNRTYGEISEQLFDIWIVGDTYVKRVRFGAGAGSDLLPVITTIPTSP